MTDDNRYSASLRISSKTLSVADITNTLDMNPSKAHEKGTPISSRNPKSRLRQESLWLLESGLDRYEPLEAHLEKLANFLEQKNAQLRSLISECDMDIFCGVFSSGEQGGTVLTHALLKSFITIPVDIVFDYYISSPSEEDETTQ